VNGIFICLKGLLRDKRGSIAVKFALAVPFIALLSVGSIDLMAVSASKSRLESIADGAALAGARSLTLAADKILAEQSAEDFVKGAISEWSGAPTVTATYVVTEASDGRRLQVTLNGHRPSFFGSMLPPGG
jgi:Flp pilus assembly protein TadG